MPGSPTHQHAELNDEQIAELFRGFAVRATRHRVQIYGALLAVQTHPTAEELHDLMHETDDRASLATVYNTLETLVEHGLVRQLASRSSGGACRYDAKTAPHVHMVMLDGRVADVPEDLSERIMESIPAEVLDQLADRMGVTVNAIKIDLACSRG